MPKTVNNHRFGFTLLELLLVLAILVALVAIFAPVVWSYRNQSNIKITRTQIGVFGNALEAYVLDHGGYPTSEQGLNALIFIPSNEGQQLYGAMTPPPGSVNPNDPNAGMNMGAYAVGGSGAFNDPNAMSGMGTGMTAMSGDMNPMGGGALAVGGVSPMGNVPGPNAGFIGDSTMMMGNGMTTDPSLMGDMNPMGGTSGSWTQPTFNPQLYLNARKRLDPFIAGDKLEIDPWGNQYRYSYNLINGINPITGDRKPAIWSAGPDRQDDTEDDIRSWDPQVAANQRAMQQQQYQMGGGVDMMGNPLQPGTMGGDMMNPMGANPMGANPMGANPMGTNPMGANPMGTNPMGANPMGANPMGTNPMGTNPMGTNPMGTNPMGANPMGANPMGANPMGANPMGTNPMGTNPMGTNPMPPQPPM